MAVAQLRETAQPKKSIQTAKNAKGARVFMWLQNRTALVPGSIQLIPTRCFSLGVLGALAVPSAESRLHDLISGTPALPLDLRPHLTPRRFMAILKDQGR